MGLFVGMNRHCGFFVVICGFNPQSVFQRPLEGARTHYSMVLTIPAFTGLPEGIQNIPTSQQ